MILGCVGYVIADRSRGIKNRNVTWLEISHPSYRTWKDACKEIICVLLV